MIDIFTNAQNFLIFDINTVINIFLSILFGVALRIALPFCNQNWVQTLQHTLSYAMLPAITFVITKVISGNIALSLGMIGALSIVRFRTPVKNPLELIFFFALITIGISSAVNIRYAFFLTGVIVFILFFLKYFNLFLRKANINYNSLSYSDGNNYNTIELETKIEIDELKNKRELVQLMLNKEEKIFIYKFATIDLKENQKLLDDLKKYEKDTKSITCNNIN